MGSLRLETGKLRGFIHYVLKKAKDLIHKENGGANKTKGSLMAAFLI